MAELEEIQKKFVEDSKPATATAIAVVSCPVWNAGARDVVKKANDLAKRQADEALKSLQEEYATKYKELEDFLTRLQVQAIADVSAQQLWLIAMKVEWEEAFSQAYNANNAAIVGKQC
ncbi:MAG: hypothetical protein NZL83_04445 [Candidatus Absconditabacterales bacterium]|nr:hypothetical protein [Candidatus Absconditabacterales bacterium]